MMTRLALLFLRAPNFLVAAWYVGRRFSHAGVVLDAKAQLVAWIVRQFRTENVAGAGAAEVRKMFHLAVVACGEPGLPVHKVETITISGAAGEMRLRLVYPRATSEPLPVVMYFHGGGFVVGDLDSYEPSARRVAIGADAIVAMPDYRLAPEAKFPAGIEDCMAATRWVADNAASFGGDPARLAISGDSAGGCITAVVAQQFRAHGGPRLAAQAMWFPITDWLPDLPSVDIFGSMDLVLTRQRMTWMRDMYVDDMTDMDDPRVAPVKADDFSDLPPAAVVTAGFDPCLDEGLLYIRKLRAAGTPVAHRHYPTQLHGFTFLAGELPEGREALDFGAACLRQCLDGSATSGTEFTTESPHD